MNEIEITVGGNKAIKKQTPSKWNELTGEQLLYFLKLKASCATPVEALEKFSMYLIGKLPGKFPGFNQAQLEDLCMQHLFLMDTTDLVKQLVPEIEVQGQKLYGPADGLSNCRFWEYLKANESFIRYQKQKNQKDLDKFIACIYRPQKKHISKDPETYTGDDRELFNENLIENRSNLIASMNHSIKEAILIFWIGANQLLQKRFPEAFADGDLKNEYGAYGLADMMAGPKFGTINQVKEAYLYECLVSACNMERMRKINKK